MRLRVVFARSNEGGYTVFVPGYTVFVPSLPGCISEGEIVDEARANIREAIALYLEPVEDTVTVGDGFVEEVDV